MQLKMYEYAMTPSSQFYFCGLPFRLDISSNCTMNCKYCFSLSRGGNIYHKNKIVDIKRLANKFDNIFNKHPKNLDVNGEFLANKVPLHLGGMSDPFSNSEISTQTLNVIDILSKYDYPLVLSTKNSSQLLDEATIKKLSQLKHLLLQISIPIPDERYSKVIEPRAPGMRKRLNDLYSLTKAGFTVAVRVQPILVPFLEILTQEFIYRLKDAGCNHVILEFLKIPIERRNSSIKKIFGEINWDGFSYYKKNNSFKVGRDWVLPPQLCFDLLLPLIKEIIQLKMTFGTTDHGLFHLGNTFCCCGISGMKGFENYYRGTYTNLIKSSNSNELLIKELLNNWIPYKSIKKYTNSTSRLLGKNDFRSFLIDKWNKPLSVNSPANYLGVVDSGYKDSDGNIIYNKVQVNELLKQMIYND
jgi:DNA repair photolyase